MELKYFNCPFEVKQESITETGVFEGFASDYIDKKDDYGDIIVKGAFTETIKQGGRNRNGIPMLWSHDATEPIGIWSGLAEQNDRIKTVGQLALGVQRADETYILMKLGSIKGLSIGWDLAKDKNGEVLEDAYEIDKKKQIRYLKKLELWEISPVVFPANRRATITSVKSVIENAKNIRDFENALREEGMSNNLAKFLASMCKDKLERKWNKTAYDIIDTIRAIRYSMKPEPRTDENREDFLERCIPQTLRDNPGMDNDQAVAICNSIWKNKGGK